MKQVRRGVFETNSSSTHSFQICSNRDSYWEYGVDFDRVDVAPISVGMSGDKEKRIGTYICNAREEYTIQTYVEPWFFEDFASVFCTKYGSLGNDINSYSSAPTTTAKQICSGFMGGDIECSNWDNKKGKTVYCPCYKALSREEMRYLLTPSVKASILYSAIVMFSHFNNLGNLKIEDFSDIQGYLDYVNEEISKTELPKIINNFLDFIKQFEGATMILPFCYDYETLKNAEWKPVKNEEITYQNVLDTCLTWCITNDCLVWAWADSSSEGFNEKTKDEIERLGLDVMEIVDNEDVFPYEIFTEYEKLEDWVLNRKSVYKAYHS